MADRLGSQHMNVAAVRRHDPYMADIVDSATQVAVYEYCSDTSDWKKTDMQGALFIYERSGPPYHSFMVLNRLNTNNLIQPLSSELEWQLQAPFLLYRTAQGTIFGLWFFYETECSRLAVLLESLCLPAGGDATTLSSVVKARSTGIDLMSLFKKASEQQQQQLAATVAPPITRPPPTAAPPGSGSRPTTPRTATVIEEQRPAGITVADLFAKASKSGQVSIGKQTVRSISVSEVEDSMPDLGGRPRGATQPRHQLAAQMSQPAPVMHQPAPVVTAQTLARHQPPPAPAATANSKDVSEASAARQAGDVDRIQKLFSTELKLAGASDPMPVPVSRTPASRTLAASDSSPAVLMSPMMFSASLAPPAAELGSSVASGDHQTAEGAAGPPSPRDDRRPVSREDDLGEVTPLTRKQLTQALTYLLKNDETFIGKLHEAYVRSLEESFKRV